MTPSLQKPQASLTEGILALADRLAGDLAPFNFISKDERDIIVSALRSSAAAPRGAQEPVAWQFRQRSGVSGVPQHQAPWCDWCSITREDYERYLRENNRLIQVRALSTAPTVGREDGPTREQCLLELADWSKIEVALRNAFPALNSLPVEKWPEKILSHRVTPAVSAEAVAGYLIENGLCAFNSPAHKHAVAILSLFPQGIDSPTVPSPDAR